MSSFPIINKQPRGMFPGKFGGNIWQTRNIDLRRSVGRISLGDKMLILLDDSDTNLTNLQTLDKFIRTNADATDRWWGLGGRMFKSTSSTIVSTWAEDTITSTPTDALDMETHESVNGEQRLVVTRDADIAILNLSGAANAWTAAWWSSTLAQTALTSGKRHPIARLQRLIAVGDVVTNTTTPIGVLHTIDKDDAVIASRITFPTGFEPRVIYASSDRFWIGLQSIFGQNARVIEWDGSSLTYNNEYELAGEIPMSGFIINNIPYFITELGYLFKFTGGSFEPIQQFPIVEEDLQFVDETSPTQVIGVGTYGCKVDRNIVYIFANAPRLSRRMRSGIWIFEPFTRNFYHSMGVGSQKTSGTELDFGQSPLNEVGGLGLARRASQFELVCGGTFYRHYAATPTLREAIWAIQFNKERTSDNGINRGYFITTYLTIPEIEAMWQALWVKFRRFVSSSNSIVLKVRARDPLEGTDSGNQDGDVLQAIGTWTATTTFTSVVPTGVLVGHEVEVMSGNGGGCSFDITTLSATADGSATITVTVDGGIPDLAAAGERGALFRFDNWDTIGSITSTTVGNQRLPLTAATHGEFLQVKVELRGFETEIEEILSIYKVKTKLE